MENYKNQPEFDGQVPLSRIINQKNFEEVKGILNSLNGQRAYNAKEVDTFLTSVAKQMESYEDNMGKLYNFYKKYRDIVKNSELGKQPSVREQIDEDPNEVDKNNSIFGERQIHRSLSKVQAHMTELLINAEEKAESIVLEAEVERDKILSDSKQKAKELLELSQEKANSMHKQAEEKINELKNVRLQMEERAKEMTKEIVKRAEEVEQMGKTFSVMGTNLKKIVDGANKGIA